VSDLTKTVRDGAIGGLLAATALILFFFFYDLIRAEALATPSFLASALLGRGDGIPDSGLIGAYTLVHYLVFAGFGIVAALIFEVAELPKNVLFGAVYGLFVGTLAFYSALIITGSDVLAAPAWGAVFFGNALAGIIIVTYLHWRSAEPGVTGAWAQFMAHKTIREGIIAGFIGAVVVAIWFLLVDMVSVHPFFTPAALGAVILEGAVGMEDVVVAPGIIVSYTLIHFAAFMLFGILLSALVTQAERFPPLVFALVILFVVFETFFVAWVAILGAWILDQIAWWSILAGNLLAAVSMSWYMWRVHPKLREELASGSALWTGD
jgi:hypothetical protein